MGWFLVAHEETGARPVAFGAVVSSVLPKAPLRPRKPGARYGCELRRVIRFSFGD